MSKPLRIALIAALVPVGLALLVGLAFLGDRAGNGGQVLGRVMVADVDLGDLSEADALAALRRPRGAPARRRPFRSPWPAAPSPSTPPRSPSTSTRPPSPPRPWSRDAKATWAASSPGGSATSSGTRAARLEIPYTYDEGALNEIIADWEVEGIADPPFPGEVTVADGRVSFRYPEAGVGIERAVGRRPARRRPRRPCAGPRSPSPSRDLPAPLAAEDIDAVVAEAEGLIAADVTLRSAPAASELVIPAAVLGRSLLVEPRRHGRRPPPSPSPGTRRPWWSSWSRRCPRLSTDAGGRRAAHRRGDRRGHHPAERRHPGARPRGAAGECRQGGAVRRPHRRPALPGGGPARGHHRGHRGPGDHGAHRGVHHPPPAAARPGSPTSTSSPTPPTAPW